MKAQRPTPELIQTVAAYVAQGAFPTTAAGAAGIDAATHRLWMDRGAKPNSRGVYKDYRRAIREAAARARVLAEIKCYEDQPKTWLTKGPGRETEEVEGFAREVKTQTVVNDHRSVNLLADPGSAAVMQLILQALGAFPDARKAVVAALGQAEGPKVIEAVPPSERPVVREGPGVDLPAEEA